MKLSTLEKEMLKYLDKKWLYIGRNMFNVLFVLNKSKNHIKHFEIFNDLFNFIEYERGKGGSLTEKLYNIKELLND